MASIGGSSSPISPYSVGATGPQTVSNEKEAEQMGLVLRFLHGSQKLETLLLKAIGVQRAFFKK